MSTSLLSSSVAVFPRGNYLEVIDGALVVFCLAANEVDISRLNRCLIVYGFKSTLNKS